MAAEKKADKKTVTQKFGDDRKKALEVFDNIVNGNMAGWQDDDGRVYGIYDEGETELKPTL